MADNDDSKAPTNGDTNGDTTEPPSKKVKTDSDGWSGHKLNCGAALMKADEGRFFSDLKNEPISVLQGIGPNAESVLSLLGVKTVEDLATYPFFLTARAIVTLADTEEERPAGSTMNIDKALDKEYEPKTFAEVRDAPTSALQGLSDKAQELLEKLGVKSVGDLGAFKYARWAEAIVQASKYEETKSDAERKQERLLKKLE